MKKTENTEQPLFKAEPADLKKSELSRVLHRLRLPKSLRHIPKNMQGPLNDGPMKRAGAQTRPSYKITSSASEHLTPELLEQYNQDGVICLRNVFSPDDVEKLRADVDARLNPLTLTSTAIDLERLRKAVWGSAQEVHESQTAFNYTDLEAPENVAEIAHDKTLDVLKMILQTDPNACENADTLPHMTPTEDDQRSGEFLIDLRAWPQYPFTERTARHSILPDICAALLQTESLCFWGDSMQEKRPKTGQRMTLHQDWAYFPITGIQSCLASVALDPTTKENGGRHFIRGSHISGDVYAANILLNQTQNPMSLYAPMPDFESNLQSLDLLEYDVQPGDVIIHHPLMLHGCKGNLSPDQTRRSISFRYCGDDIRYFDKPGALETKFMTSRPETGTRLNPDYFPHVWQKPLD